MLKPAAPLLLLLLTVLGFARAETPAVEAAAPGVVSAEATPAPAQTVAAPAGITVAPEVVPATESAPLVPTAPSKRVVVYVIPVRGDISDPILYIVRRGLKEAIAKNADAIILDMKTQGGPTDAMFGIVEAIDQFHGETVTYINHEAGSAGAIIAGTTKEIYFAPKAVMGAALVVQGGGAEIPESMKMKITSFYGAKASAYAEGKGRYRIDVIRAMMDAKFEFKIGEVVIKEKDSTLTLRASQAVQLYGNPPEPLLAVGIVDSIDALLAKKYGAGNFTIKQFQVTWSEELAQYLNKISSILLGLGLLALFIEFKTPGFGIFGVSGIVLLVIVFLSNYVAGLSGHEPLLLFAVGLILLALELFLFPGVAIVAVIGLVMMLGSLVWAMADLWPGVPLTTAWSGDVFVAPLQNLGLGLVLAVGLALALMRYLPKGWMWDKMIVGTSIGGAAQVGGVSPDAAHALGTIIGQRGVAVTVLRPSGQIEIAGRRYEATVEVGAVDAGDEIVVRGRKDFALIVERSNS